MKNLNYKEKIIIETIHKYGGAMSVNEISKLSGISFATVKKYIFGLVDEGILIEKISTERKKYYMNYELILGK